MASDLGSVMRKAGSGFLWLFDWMDFTSLVAQPETRLMIAVMLFVMIPACIVVVWLNRKGWIGLEDAHFYALIATMGPLIVSAIGLLFWQKGFASKEPYVLTASAAAMVLYALSSQCWKVKETRPPRTFVEKSVSVLIKALARTTSPYVWGCRMSAPIIVVWLSKMWENGVTNKKTHVVTIFLLATVWSFVWLQWDCLSAVLEHSMTGRDQEAELDDNEKLEPYTDEKDEKLIDV